MWKGKLDVSKLNENVSIEYKMSNKSYIKSKVRKCREEYIKQYCLNTKKNKNAKLYLFLMLDNFENINLMQQFEINYLKSKAKDLEATTHLIESGIPQAIVERQLNVKMSFVNKLIDGGYLEFIKNFKGKEDKYKFKVKKGYRIIETDGLLAEYERFKIEIIGYIRDGYTVSDTLDEVGSIYNTREWMTFMDILESEGYDLRGTDALEDVLMMKLEGHLEEDIEIELGFRGTIEEASKTILKGMLDVIDIKSIDDKVVKEYQDIRETIDFESKVDLVKGDALTILTHLSRKKGIELLTFLDTYVYEYGSLEGAIRTLTRER